MENKRTGYVLARLILLAGDFDIKANQKQKYDFVINVSTNRIGFDQIVDWLKKHTITTL